MENLDGVEDESWQKYRACKDMAPDIFFPSGAKGLKAAQRICMGCVVKDECLDYALRKKEMDGVWGGTSERERARLLGQNR